MSHGHPPYPDPVPSDGYEKLDAHPSAIVKFLVWLFVASAAILFAMWGLLEAYKLMPLPESNVERHPLAAEREIPYAPQLEAMKGVHKGLDGEMVSQDGGPYFNTKMWKDWDRQWRSNLDTYGWIDPSSRIVRVPIERAMELKLEKGFPTAPKPGN
jgi:hypothetical protein